MPTRLVNLADVVEVFHHAGGLDAAIAVARQRSGTQFDPQLVEIFCDAAEEIFTELESVTNWDALMAAEPALDPEMTDDEFDRALEDNIGNPIAPFIYAVSTLHCMTVSLASGGAGLGTAWGEQVALQMLADVGFGPITVHDAPGDPGNAVFVTTRPAPSDLLVTIPERGPVRLG